jgi:TP901 family phage tail tape measure protein
MGVSSSEIWMILRARDEASRAIRSLGRSFGELDKDAINAAHKQLDRGRALSTMGAGLVAVGAAGFVALESMGRGAREYDKAAAAALTQTDNIGASLGELKEMGLDIARTVPVQLEQIQPALYDIFSSIDVGLSESRVLLKQFAKDAVAGNTDMQTATRANLQVMNAYSLEVKDAHKVSDFFFQLVRKGVGTYQEMTAAVGKAIPSAARAGQSYEQLGGMIAFMTRQGLTAAQAGTSAARALDAMSHPETVKKMEAMGLSVKDAAGNFRPMNEIVQQLHEKLGKLTAPERAKRLFELFKGSGGTIQARRFFDSALKNMDDYQKLTKAMGDAGGSAKRAFDIMKNTDQGKQQQALNNLKAFRIELGDIYNDIRTKVIVVLGDLAKMFGNLPDGVKKAIVLFVLVASVMSVIVGVGLVLAGAFLVADAAITLMGASLGAVAVIGVGVIAAIALIAAGAYLIYKNWDKIGPYVEKVWNWVLQASKKVWDWLQQNFGSKSDFGKGMKQALEEIQEAWAKLVGKFEGMWPAIKAVIQGLAPLFAWLAGVAMAFLNAWVPVLTGVLAAVKNMVVGVMGILGGLAQFLTGVMQIIGGILTLNWGMIKAGVLNILGGLWSAIVALFTGLVQSIGNIVKGLVLGVITFFKHLYDVLVGHSIIPDLVNGIIRWISMLPGRVLSVIAGMVRSAITFFGNLWSNAVSAFRTGIDKVVSAAKELPGRVWRGLGKLGGYLVDIGEDLVRGLITGVGNMARALVDKVKGVVSSAIEGAKNLLGIGSPSKVFAEIGMFVDEGLIRGLHSMITDVERASEKLAAATIPDRDMAYKAAAAQGYNRPVDPLNSMAPHIEYKADIQINTQELDPRQHAAQLGFALFERVS